MAAYVTLDEVTVEQFPAVTALCRRALDLPEDAMEAAWIVDRLRPSAFSSGPAGSASTSRVSGPAGSASTSRVSGPAGSPATSHVSDPAADPGGHTIGFVARHGGTPIGVVLASGSAQDPAVGHVDLIAVDPDHRRQGVGRALIGRVEEALSVLGVRTVLLAGNPPRYAWPGIDVRYTPAVCLALALGYEQDRTAWNMTVELTGPDSPALRDTDATERRLAAAGVSVRRATPADLPALVDFARSTFSGAWDAEITDSVRQPDGGCHIALRDGILLGFAAYGSSRPSWFGPMGTAPAAEGLGIGGLLLRRCLVDQHRAGHDRVQIGWVGPVPFYARSVGARIERVFVLYRKPLRT